VVKVLYSPKIWKKPEDGEDEYQKAEAEYRNKLKIMDEFGAKLKENDIGVVCEGTARYGQRNDLTFFLRSISYCDIDYKSIIHEKTFIVPESYQRVFPTPYIDTVRSGDKIISNFLKNKRIVVFDFETTGIDPERDKPIELGAVSIENGIIKEQFSTFINPGFPIPSEIIELTHITDEDVKDAPSIEDVLPDFYKFSEGAVLAAHNIDFDFAFLKNNGKPLGINFNNPINDTLAMGRARYSTLKNHKLETLCGHLGIVNEGAHRAIYDAISTARLYICLVE
jgi:DNA polymerase III epsilon subunit family exonuclease